MVWEITPEVFSAWLRGGKTSSGSQTGNATGRTNRSSSFSSCTLFIFSRLCWSGGSKCSHAFHKLLVLFQNVFRDLNSWLCFFFFFAQEDCDNPGVRNPAELVCVVLLPDPLRSGQGCGDPLQHHGSWRRSAAERHLQHRPHQRQYVCHTTPRQRGQGLFPCKNKTRLFLPPHCSSYVCLIISPTSPSLFIIRFSFLPPSLAWFSPLAVSYSTFAAAGPDTDDTGASRQTMINASGKHTSAVTHRLKSCHGGVGGWGGAIGGPRKWWVRVEVEIWELLFLFFLSELMCTRTCVRC